MLRVLASVAFFLVSALYALLALAVPALATAAGTYYIAVVVSYGVVMLIARHRRE